MLEHLPLPFDKAVIYCRVSTKSQKINLQEDICLSFANDRNLEVINVFKEKVSGNFTNKGHRPELYKALECCNKYNSILLVKSVDRLFRNIAGLSVIENLGCICAMEQEILVPFYIGNLHEILRKKKNDALCMLAEYIIKLYKQDEIESIYSNGFYQKIKTKSDYNVIISPKGVFFGNDKDFQYFRRND